MWTDDLTSAEAEYMKLVLRELGLAPWAQPLVDRITESGGIRRENKPRLFEARFAYELLRAGATVEYEYAAGVGNSTVDFRVLGNPEWLVELVSLHETQTLKNAVREVDGIYKLVLSTDAENEGESEEAEMIRAIMKIGDKVGHSGAPTKFPTPDGRVHLVMVDTRGYLGNGGDAIDFIQMANGASHIPESKRWATHYMSGQPIRGLFEKAGKHPLSAARIAQERLHFIGFVSETKYETGEITERAYYRGNPNLIHSNAELKRIGQAFPLCREMI